jgi:hypothetical protein
MSETKPLRRARRIEADPRTDEFVTLFKRYGETVLAYIAHQTQQPINAKLLARINREVEPVLRGRVESLVKDYLQTAYKTLTGENVEPQEVGYRVQFPRRRRFHLRLLTLSYSDLVSFDDRSHQWQPNGKTLRPAPQPPTLFPKSLIDGIDLWTRQSLAGSDIVAANRIAFQALDRLDVTADGATRESDRDLWRRLHELDDAMTLVCPVLMPLLQPFHQDFEAARTQMQRVIGIGSEGRVQLNARMWDLLFARIFGRVLRAVGTAERPEFVAKVDVPARVMTTEVMKRYRKWRVENQFK